jgi:hypothetical protein
MAGVDSFCPQIGDLFARFERLEGQGWPAVGGRGRTCAVSRLCKGRRPAYLLSLIMGMLLPHAAQAIPILTWTQPFQVSPPTTSGTVTGTFANFGQAALANLQTTNLGAAGDTGAATAFLRAGAAVASSPTAVSYSMIQIDFERDFTLEGSPGGWSVSLTGTIAGILQATLIGQQSGAEVEADADVFNTPASLLFRTTIDNTAPNPTQTTAGTGSTILQDGTYTFAGSLRAEASIGSSSCGTCVSFVDFVNGLAGFSVTLSAVPLDLVSAPIPPGSTTESLPDTSPVYVSASFPIPEPGTLPLVCSGLVGLVFWRSRLR